MAVINNETEITGFERLYDSMHKCRKNVGWKDSTAHFCLNGIEEVLKLSNQLKTDTYTPRNPKKIIITYPKRREALSIAFRDRVYQRSLNDNVLYPVMTASFIYDNMACQTGKGPDLASDRLDRFIRRHYINYGIEGAVLQCDIAKYYPSMDHEIVEDMFRQKLPPEIFDMVQTILRTQYSGFKGYSPGSQMIQIAGISLLDPLDHFIKEKLHIRNYIRYMDDFILIHPDKRYLGYCKSEIERFLAGYKLELNTRKSRIFKLKDGIEFLGFTHRLTSTGKVIRTIQPEKVKHERKKLRRMVRKAKKGLLTKGKVDQCYDSWREHASHGNSYELLQRMDQYYKALWREDYDL